MAGFTQAECLAFIKSLFEQFWREKILKFLSIDYNMVKVAQGEVSKWPGNVFYSWTALGSP